VTVGAKERRKGKCFELEVRKVMHDFGFPVERNLEYREGVGWDLECEDPEAPANIRVQCKRRARIAFLTEVEESFGKGPDKWFKFWALRQDRGRTMAVLPLEDLLEVLQHGSF
jgi:hypothetical protein